MNKTQKENRQVTEDEGPMVNPEEEDNHEEDKDRQEQTGIDQMENRSEAQWIAHPKEAKDLGSGVDTHQNQLR